jgi:hypothetical protein
VTKPSPSLVIKSGKVLAREEQGMRAGRGTRDEEGMREGLTICDVHSPWKGRRAREEGGDVPTVCMSNKKLF